MKAILLLLIIFMTFPWAMRLILQGQISVSPGLHYLDIAWGAKEESLWRKALLDSFIGLNLEHKEALGKSPES